MRRDSGASSQAKQACAVLRDGKRGGWGEGEPTRTQIPVGAAAAWSPDLAVKSKARLGKNRQLKRDRVPHRYPAAFTSPSGFGHYLRCSVLLPHLPPSSR